MPTSNSRASRLAALVVVVCACSSTSEPETPKLPVGPRGATLPGEPELAIPCDDALASIDGPPGALTEPPGTVLRCARDRAMTRDEVQGFLDDAHFVGKPATSGLVAYRILYRTERATIPPSAGYSSAIVVLPTTPRAREVPVVSVSHGAGGQSPKCAQSKYGIDSPKSDLLVMMLGMAGSGFPVVASDYAGFSNYGAPGNPPSGMALSEDVAKSTLDSIRALRKMAPAGLGPKSFLVGQSQGGHTVLSTLALAEGYAPEIEIGGVKAFTPLWFSQASWGAIFLLGDTFALSKNVFQTAVGVYYLYSHGAIQDGPELDSAAAMFAPDKRETVKRFFDENCGGQHYDWLAAVAKIPADLYDPDFVEGVMNAAALGEPCSQRENPKQRAFCEKWIPRYAADRPHVTGKAAKVPILLSYGGNDTVIPPERATCGIERLVKDGANLTVCFDKGADHSSIVRTQGGRAVEWVAALALGEPGPSAPCDGDASAITDAEGARATCASLPPND